MANSVELTVKSQLNKLLEDLADIQKKSKGVGEELKKMGDGVSDGLKQNTNEAKTFLQGVRDMGARVADQLRRDFKSLLSLEGLQASLKLTEQFKGTIKEAVSLNDVIRKLGRTFQIPADAWTDFHSSMVKGLGSLGLASDIGARVMEGLVDTPVRGQKELIEYSKIAGQLSSLSGEKGQEGVIAKGIADVIKARGGNVKDLNEVSKVAEDVRRAFEVSGAKPGAILGTMNEIFQSLPVEKRKQVTSRSLANVAAIGQTAGPGAMQFMKEALSKGKIGGSIMSAFGMGDMFKNGGLDFEKFGKSAHNLMNLIQGDARASAEVAGLSPEAAQGLINMANNLKELKEVQDRVNKSTGNLTEQYQNSMGLGEAFGHNLSQASKGINGILAPFINGATDLLSKTSQSTAGSMLVAGGGGILAALLAGGGLRGIGGAIGGAAKGAAFGEVTGKGVQPVYVVNAAEIGGGGLGGVAAGGMLGKFGALLTNPWVAGTIAATAAGGLAGAGEGLGIHGVSMKSKEGFEGNLIQQLMFQIGKTFGTENARKIQQAHIVLDLKSDKLKAEKHLPLGMIQ